MIAELVGLGSYALGGRQREARLATLVSSLVARPEVSLPEACGSWAATLGAYRFLHNEAVSVEGLVAQTGQATAARCAGEAVVLAVQDTTSYDFTSHRVLAAELGPLENAKRRGVFAHTSLALTADGLPLGVLDQEIWGRDPAAVGKAAQRHDLPVEAKESARWLRGVRRARERLGEGVTMVVVADREADLYELYALADQLGVEAVIRARHDRALAGDAGKLVAAVEAAPILSTSAVVLADPAGRADRSVRVAVRAQTVTLRPPPRAEAAIAAWWAAHPEAEPLLDTPLSPLTLGVVLVSEVDPPAGVTPLRWLLLTTLPVDTPAAALRCVGYYRLRWLVERYHFVMKSGCRLEALQLQAAEAVRRAPVVYGLVAWCLLWLTYQARRTPDAPCTGVLDAPTWRLLHAAAAPKTPLPAAPPSLHTAVRQIAQLGGFLARKGDGEPGVQTIWRGLKRLHDLLLAYRTLQLHPELLDREHLFV